MKIAFLIVMASLNFGLLVAGEGNWRNGVAFGCCTAAVLGHVWLRTRRNP